jgi:CubicO group peptidase (beta-lactamase class C family)
MGMTGRRLLLALAAAVTLAIVLGLLVRPRPLPQDRREALQAVLAGVVRNDAGIRNCVLAVASGDGTFAWQGAAGVADQRTGAAMTPATPIYVASVTKLYTATAIMMLYERGGLALDDPMAKYLPPDLIRGIHTYEGRDYAGEITIAQLLAHRSGIADYYEERAKDGKTLAELLREAPDRPWTVEQAIARARDDMTANFAPGARTSYSDTNYQLLGKIIETVARQPLHVVYEDFFFRPLGLEHTWLAGHPRPGAAAPARPADVFHGSRDISASRASGAYWADGGIVSTAGDLIVFLKALNQDRLVRPATLERMHQWRRWRFPMRYGYGTMDFELPQPLRWLTKLPPLWGHSGSTGSFLYYAKDLDLYLAGTIDQTESGVKPFLLLGRVTRLLQP